jgi:DNA polymerase III alpha subunit
MDHCIGNMKRRTFTWPEKARELARSNTESDGPQRQQLVSRLSQMTIANTVELSSRLEFELDNLGYEFPHYPVPSAETEISYLRAQVEKGAGERYRPVTDRVRR